jgi:hypothetical protein
LFGIEDYHHLRKIKEQSDHINYLNSVRDSDFVYEPQYLVMMKVRSVPTGLRSEAVLLKFFYSNVKPDC